MAIVHAMLAHHYNGEDVRGWYMSRKLNGFRCIWKKGKLWTLGRYSGEKEIYAPKWFIDQLPDFDLDGELWHPSDCLATTKSICGQGMEKSLIDERWHEIQYMVFNEFNSERMWEQSRGRLQLLLPESDNLKLLEQELIGYGLPAMEQMGDYLKYLRRNYGEVEGLMLANPNGYYEFKRSKNLLKYKSVYDMEGTVVEQTAGEGKHEGRMGALRVKFTWDEKVSSVYGGSAKMVNRTIIFSIGGGFSDEDRERTDWVGKRIRFEYYGVTENGVPVSANYVGDAC